LGHIHRNEHADSIVPILVSLQRWTFYYWEQDRVGMLVPLLALPFHNPFANLLVEGWVSISCGLAAFFLLARYMVRRPVWPMVATFAIAYSLAFAPAVIQFDWLIAQNQYAVSLTLTLAAIPLIEREAENAALSWRLWMALLLSALANWVNVSAAIELIPLLLLQWVESGAAGRFGLELRSSRKIAPESIKRLAGDPRVRGLALLLFGAAAGRLMLLFVRHRSTSLGQVPMREWFAAWSQSADAVLRGISPRPIYLVWLISPALLGILALLFRRAWLASFRRTSGIAACLVGAAVIWWLTVGTSIWVKQNLYNIRYFIPSLFFLAVSIAVLTVAAVPESIADVRHGYLLSCCSVVLLSSALYFYGPPSAATARTDIDQRFGAVTKDLLAAHVNLLAGNYWTVWPEVFNANLLLYERGQRGEIYGLAVRSRPTRRFWSKIPLDEVRVAIPIGQEAEGQSWLREYGFHLKEVQRLAKIEVFAAESIGR
jgi:hypothetical protein